MPSSTVDPQQLAQRIREAIRDSGLSQREVSKQIELDETKLSKSLTGVRRLNSDELLKMARVTGVTTNWLLTGRDDGLEMTGPVRIPPNRSVEESEKALRRRRIIEEAWWLFAQRGYADVRIADIARQAGVSSPAVHYYFATKRAIFAETLRYSVKLAFDRQIASLFTIEGPVERLIELCRLQLPITEERRASWSIWLQTWADVATVDDGRKNHAEGYQRWQQMVRSIIVEGQEFGVFRLADPDALTSDLTSLIDGYGIKVMTGLVSGDRMLRHVAGYIESHLVIGKPPG
ncbi:TetR/AcrR family transcriptional regulator [Paramicrobacterium chengjingii]|uniref:TetR family transcriptional regulator C-terminal domain-containing protein n=1 Tax=Paramicrobacterium chengjingii TaxID=2769067 RepID=A0ABX6YJI7_9MICO|nr:TetR/AcrR family transcriptional regulator [Microbacterium chengjingii]QPZ38566.1 TetR family transcriptional regulator C-terminal domain-containing protein [Microbacterium chengjingii]